MLLGPSSEACISSVVRRGEQCPLQVVDPIGPWTGMEPCEGDGEIGGSSLLQHGCPDGTVVQVQAPPMRQREPQGTGDRRQGTLDGTESRGGLPDIVEKGGFRDRTVIGTGAIQDLQCVPLILWRLAEEEPLKPRPDRSLHSLLFSRRQRPC